MNHLQKASKFAKAIVTRTLDFEFGRIPCRLEKVTPGQLATLYRSVLNCMSSRPLSPWYPTFLHVETSAVCTLRCPLCPVGIEAVKRKEKFMPFDMLKALIDETADRAVLAMLWGWGEPLLNTGISDMIAYTHSRNMVTVLSTNGQHLHTPEEAEKIVAAGLDILIVDLDGATQETYGKYRKNGQLQNVLTTMALINRAKTNLGVQKPRVNAQIVVTKHNEGEFPQIRELAQKHGADWVSMMTAHMADYFGDDADERFAPSDPFYQRFEYDGQKRVRRSANQYRCRRPWSRLNVTSEGVVVPCEYDLNGDFAFGTWGNGRSFMQAWLSKEASVFREQMIVDKTAYPFCVDCLHRDRKQKECTVDLIPLKH